MQTIENLGERSKMRAGGIRWLKRVAIATAMLTAVGLLAGTDRLMATPETGDLTPTAIEQPSASAMLRKNDSGSTGFELYADRRVEALSTVRHVGEHAASGSSVRLAIGVI